VIVESETGRTALSPDGAAFTTLVDPAWGAHKVWTPVVVQGATPTFALNTATYFRSGRMIDFNAVVTLTSAGTAGNVITISLPVPAKSSYSIFSIFGSGGLAAATEFAGLLAFASATTVKITSSPSVLSTYLGTTNFTSALAANNVLTVQGRYEAATDA
jgi:hypothetical protein